MKKTLIALLLLTTNIAYSEPGNREIKGDWFGLRPIEDQVISKLENVSELEQELQSDLIDVTIAYNESNSELRKKKEDAPYIGKPFITDSKEDFEVLIEELEKEYTEDTEDIKHDYENKINKNVLVIENVLSSPNKNAINSIKIEKSQHIENRELLELYNSTLNLVLIVKKLNNALRVDPTNSTLAIKSYDTQTILLNVVIQMFDEFVSRIDNIYSVKVKLSTKKIKLNIKQIESQEEVLGIDFVNRQISKLNRIINSNDIVLSKLEVHKNRIIEKRFVFEAYSKKVIALNSVASAAEESNAYISMINDDLESLNVELPELIEFDYTSDILL